MTATELKEILDKHKKWLNDEDGGEQADLRGADLRGANLRDADLCVADLSGADLSGADLVNANLAGANFRDAYLYDANLRGVNLSGADLRGAGIAKANLCGANLRDADLIGADLCVANLRGANLDYSCLPLWCGSLGAQFDDRQIIQILYHTVKAGTESPNVSNELKEILLGLADTANKFHRVKECGRIERRKDNV